MEHEKRDGEGVEQGETGGEADDAEEVGEGEGADVAPAGLDAFGEEANGEPVDHAGDDRADGGETGQEPNGGE